MHDLHETVCLPSGATAMVKKGKGRDLIRAQRAVPPNAEPIALTFALIAELTEIDGNKIVYDDVLEMDLEDVLRLLPLVVKTDELPLRPDSPVSSGSVSL
jgi:hypothetical protein